MASKKLKVEVELETAKAKRQAKELEKSGGAGAVPGGTADVGDESERAARSLRSLGDSAKATQVNMRSAAKALTGIAVGLAGSYAANQVRDPDAKAAIEYGSNAVSGASMGAMVAGPVGAAVGGLAGILKTYFDREGERRQMSRDFEVSEERYRSAQAANEKLRDLTETRRGGGTAAQLPEMRSIMDNFRESAEKLVKAYREELKSANPDKERLESLRVNIDYSRQMADRYEGAINSIEDLRHNNRANFTGLDMFQKIGGGGGEGGGRSISERLQKEGNDTLKEIARNTKERSGTWQ